MTWPGRDKRRLGRAGDLPWVGDQVCLSEEVAVKLDLEEEDPTRAEGMGTGGGPLRP